MKKEEVFLAWAPKESLWSPWVLPVPFAQLNCLDFAEAATDSSQVTKPTWMPDANREGLAYVIDIPGGQAMLCGIMLAGMGILPVPVIDGSPGEGEFYFNKEPQTSTTSAWHPNVAVDMTELLRELCQGASVLQRMTFRMNAMPAFLLDSKRMTGYNPLRDDVYDNRWQVFPQDFPSAKFLLEHGVRRVLLVQERKAQPLEDLSHILLRWQEAGIAIENVGTTDGSSVSEIRIAKPSRFRRIWYRALAILGLRRSWSGGFGGFPWSTSG
jgi:hypothetical protein